MDRVIVSRRLGQWRWKYLAAGNNKKLATSGESYHNLDDLLLSLTRVLDIPPQGRQWVQVESGRKWLVTVKRLYNTEPRKLHIEVRK